jgi:hypothetical protein
MPVKIESWTIALRIPAKSGETALEERPPTMRPIGWNIRNAQRLAGIAAAAAFVAAVAPVAAKADPLAIGPLTPAARVTPAGYLTPWPGACPFGTHYTCWRGSYGGRFCGCWAGGDRPACPTGYYYTCRPDPFGNPYCACY